MLSRVLDGPSGVREKDRRQTGTEVREIVETGPRSIKRNVGPERRRYGYRNCETGEKTKSLNENGPYEKTKDLKIRRHKDPVGLGTRGRTYPYSQIYHCRRRTNGMETIT